MQIKEILEKFNLFENEYITKIAKLLKKKDYFNTVWKKYTFRIDKDAYTRIDDTYVEIGMNIQAVGVDAGISFDVTTLDGDLRFMLIPADFTSATGDFEEPLNAYEEIYEAAFNKSTDDTVQFGKYDRVIKELAYLTNDRIAAIAKMRMEELLITYKKELDLALKNSKK